MTAIEVEIPTSIRNLDLFNSIKLNQTPVRPSNRQLYINKLLECKPDDIKNVLFLSDNQTKRFRAAIETMSAAKQCQKTIGDKCVLPGESNIFTFDADKDNTHCWLCGFPFVCGSKPNIDCEHLIPITYAGLFTGIKTSRKIAGQFTDAFIDAYSTNYLYAHSSCNRTKSALMLLKWDDAEGMVFDEDKGRELQNRILNVGTVPQINAVKYNAEYKSQMLANYRAKMSVISRFINAEYAEFLKEGMSMTDYIKYIIGMTQLYFSKKTLENLKDEGDRRESMSNLMGNVEIESVKIYDVVQDNILHTTAKKASLSHRINVPRLKRVLFSVSKSGSKSRSRSRSKPKSNNTPIAKRTRSQYRYGGTPK